MPKVEQRQMTDIQKALNMLLNGKCPDGGGPQCTCRCIGKPGQCVRLRGHPKCTVCDDRGVYTCGTFSDVCGECFGTKYQLDVAPTEGPSK